MNWASLIGDLPGFDYKLIIELLPMIHATMSIANNRTEKGTTIKIILTDLDEDKYPEEFEPL